MINRERLITEFVRLTGFDAESYEEAEIAAELTRRLLSLGLSVSQDDAGNLYALLEGTTRGEPRLFAAHMDTVSPGKGKRAVLYSDGTIRSDGTTVLGADNVSGLVSILEALTVIREEQLPHPPIEVLFTAAEEPYSRGCASFDYSRLRSKDAYVLDLPGPVGTAAIAAPSILSVEVTVRGRAAHAGFAPEDGINALTITARALASLETGRIAPDTTVNFGLISGGVGKNIVPAEVSVHGEIRSLRHDAALAQGEAIRTRFRQEADALGGETEVTVTEELRAYRIPEDAPAVVRFRRALDELGYGTARLITTFGGSDNNRLAAHGLRGIVTACAMENVHTTEEYTVISQLERSAALTLQLMTMEESEDEGYPVLSSG